MPQPSFVHLRLHSEFSVQDGITRIKDAVKLAAADQQGALALTDLGNTFGLIKFYKAAQGAGVKPIMGADIWVTNVNDLVQPHRMLLLVKNRAGYLRLCDLLSQAYLQTDRLTHGQIHPEWLTQHPELKLGLIALSGSHLGDV